MIMITAVDCGNLAPPPNGSVDTPYGTTYGNIAMYSCNVGFKLSASKYRVCEANGQWSLQLPVCQGE